MIGRVLQGNLFAIIMLFVPGHNAADVTLAWMIGASFGATFVPIDWLFGPAER